METRLRSDNHGNRWGVGRAGILNWHRELRGSTQLSQEGKLGPPKAKSPPIPFQKEESDIQRT